MTATIHSTALVADGAKLGEGVVIGPYCSVSADTVLGAHVELKSHVVIEGKTSIGADSVVYPFAVLGCPPQDLKFKGEDVSLVIGARNVIREHVTMHPGTGVGRKITTVGDDGFFMVGSHVAHDCVIGNRVVFANGVAVGGYAVVGDFVIMGGLAAIHQHSRIGKHAFVGGGAIVTQDVIPYGSVIGNQAKLGGLNLIGLKRRGFSREVIDDIRASYRMLFADEGTFQERLEDVERNLGHSDAVREIIAFIRADASRSLCMPG
jgi:UDP-N-acetylglucosamine acyltransferase